MALTLSDLLPQPFVWGAGGERLTPEEVERQRKIAAALMGQTIDASPVAHPLEGLARVANAAAGGFARRRAESKADAGERGLSQWNTGMMGNIASLLGGSGGGGGFPAAPSGGAAGPTASTVDAPEVAEIASYIRDAAAKRGIDPEIALKVARSEGLGPGIWQSNYHKDGKRETSYGPFQLLVGGGLGDKFQKLYGKSPEDPSTVFQQIDFALDEAAQGGWGPWYGAAKVGVGRRTGLDNARALGVQQAAGPVQVASLDPGIGVPNPGGIPDPGIGVENSGALPDPGMTVNPVAAILAAGQPQPEQQAGVGIGPAPVPAVPPTAVPPVEPMPVTGVDVPQQAPAPMQVAQAMPREEMSGRADVGGGMNPAIMEALTSPYSDENTRGVAKLLLQQQLEAQAAQQKMQMEQQMQQADPMRQLQLKKLQQEIDLGANTNSNDIVDVGKGRLYNKRTKEWIIAPDMATDAPTVQTFYDPEGREYKAQWDAQAGEWVPVGGAKAPSGMTLTTNPDGTVSFTQGGAGQKLTEVQSKDVALYTRGMEADSTLAVTDKQLTDFAQQNAGRLPLGVGNYLRTPEFRQAKQAADSFLAVILRKDTGAAVTDKEFDFYSPIFLPQPGDDDATIMQKRRARQIALIGIRSGLGTAEALADANRIILGLPEERLIMGPHSKGARTTKSGVEWSIEP